MKQGIAIIYKKKWGFKRGWAFPFSLWIYPIKNAGLSIQKYYHLIEITIYKLNIIITWGDED